MIYRQLTKSDFRDAFDRAGRGDHFSYDGLGVLYDYLGELDGNYELDVIGLCCEFEENAIDLLLEGYGLDSLEELEDATTVLLVGEDTAVIVSY